MDNFTSFMAGATLIAVLVVIGSIIFDPFECHNSTALIELQPLESVSFGDIRPALKADLANYTCELGVSYEQGRFKNMGTTPKSCVISFRDCRDKCEWGDVNA